MLIVPVWGTLRGAGEEKVGRCLEGVLVEGVGVAMVVEAWNIDSITKVWTCGESSEVTANNALSCRRLEV